MVFQGAPPGLSNGPLVIKNKKGWVIERGWVVSLLMFVDPFCRLAFCGFMSFCQVRVSIPLVLLFSVHRPSNMDISSPEKYSIFGGSFHKTTVGPWFWHIKAVFFSAPRFGHICAKVLPVRDIRNVVGS